MNKINSKSKGLIYIQLNDDDQFVLSHGIEFAQFIQSAPTTIENILLLKHQFVDSDFNAHTMLPYVPRKRLQKITKDDVYNYNEFCWLDFVGIAGLNELSEIEIAELLYLGHKKQHLRSPFYNKLANNYVYLGQADGWFNKTYYRNMTNFYAMLGNVVAKELSNKKLERRLFRFSRRRLYPAIEQEILMQLNDLMKIGLSISLERASATRNGVEIPIWVLGDFVNMDNMYDEYKIRSKRNSDAKLVYDRKCRSWCIQRK